MFVDIFLLGQKIALLFSSSIIIVDPTKRDMKSSGVPLDPSNSKNSDNDTVINSASEGHNSSSCNSNSNKANIGALFHRLLLTKEVVDVPLELIDSFPTELA